MKKILIFAVLLLSFTSCTKSQQKHVLDGFALGTTYHIVYYSSEEIAQEKIDSLLNDFENDCSVYRSNSTLSRINRGEEIVVSKAIGECIRVAKEVNKSSSGLYDITIKPLVEAYGFYSENETHGFVNTDSLREFIGLDKVKLIGDTIIKTDKRVQLDLNSLAKGYSVDVVSRWLEKQGIIDYLVEIGGEIYCQGDNDNKLWRIGIDRPIDGNYSPGADMQFIVSLSNKALATSGNYRRNYIDKKGKRINHTFNPITLTSSTNEMASVTIIASTDIEADAYATAVMAMGFEKGKMMVDSLPNIEALFIFHRGDTLATYLSKGMDKLNIEE